MNQYISTTNIYISTKKISVVHERDFLYAYTDMYIATIARNPRARAVYNTLYDKITTT